MFPVTLILTVLPTAEAGTKHLTEVGESNVVIDETELESAKIMRHKLEELKFGTKVETSTVTASNLENGGFNTTTAESDGGVVVTAGAAADVVAAAAADVAPSGPGSCMIPNCVRCDVEIVACVCVTLMTLHPSCFQSRVIVSQ